MSKRITDDFINKLAKEIKLKKKKKDVDDREQLFYRSKKKYKRLRVEVRKPNEQWQIDLVDMTFMERYNSRVKYLLVVMDVFSRFVWVKKLRSKNSKDVSNKFDEIIGKNGVPDTIHSDKGGEFSEIRKNAKNGIFGKNVKYRSSENYEMKSVMIERFIRTLRMMISNVLYGLYGKTEGRYTNILDKIIEKYNKTPHKGIDGNNPYDIYEGNISLSKIFRYKKYFEFYPFYKRGMILKEGQRVRIARLKSRFEKESTFTYSKEIFVVDKVRLTDPVTYVIRDKNEEILSGVFYREELLKV